MNANPVKSASSESQTNAVSGWLMLVVNLASQCGLTPKYEGLQKLYAAKRAQGLEILGFPANNFGAQEPGTEPEIAAFCSTEYGVEFPMFAKIAVNGGDAHPLYKHLKNERPGVLGIEAIKWNFTKFLVGRNGGVLDRYAPTDKPEALEKDIEAALAEPAAFTSGASG